TLSHAFNHDDYLNFLKEFLVNIHLVAPDRERKPYNTFSAAITNFRQLGDYTGDDGNKVALFSVCLTNDKNLSNARSMQRSFIKSLLESSNCAGALVAFYTDGELEKWRLSLVRMDYEFSKGKISEKLTPAKRYSYLVGDKEPCHTAMERLFPIFVSDEHNPSLDELEEAFSVEAVTDEFFRQYRDKYLDLKEYLDSNSSFVAEAESRGFDSEQFAKKLMGQIVFLYFIQKKGWLGVNAFPKTLTEREYKNAFYRPGQKPKELLPMVYKKAQDGLFHRDVAALRSLSAEDETMLSTLVKGDPWGSGPRTFMREIFKGCVEVDKNFFDDYLEPLFYTGLNQNRGENAFFPPLHRRIPFLNGGLFEEMEGYDWKNNDFSIPNEIFSNVDTKGRDADGILDVFDRFNFTMAEDEPMEREVAIDPEMLGKVFENLLDVSDRKSKGAFYTPREIVHYMCQESLISYLSGKTGISDEDIRKFVLYGEYFRDDDVRKTLPVDNETGTVLVGDEVFSSAHKHHMEFDKEKILEMPESIFSYRNNVNRLQELDDLLAEVKVVDPAVGSGAFPLGMITEIVKARETITTYMTIEMNSHQRLNFRSGRNPYWMKRQTIKNSIFGCDLEVSATDIAKLRLWLSLVIDNFIMDQENEELGYSTKPRELPNLDCNIICGDSLMDEFCGIPLITESSVLGNESEYRNASIFDQKLDIMINDLIDLQSRLYDEKDHVAKESLKVQIQDIYNEIVMEQIQGNPDVIDQYYQAIQRPSKPFVLWQLYFPKVFRDNGGFDIVIGNPPYIQLQKMINEDTGAKLGDQYQKLGFDTFAKTGDIYCLFYEKGYNLLRKGGVLAFITSNKWMRAGYGAKLRGFLAEKTNPVFLIDFAGQKVFE
ncbi:MAG: Eco57I restriction-modification methylase domain-containing protein, partial [Clostridiales bacterium]|nr:Eco57I restriction-modification methylase domain-containing protein [Clostridiales bacterium]